MNYTLTGTLSEGYLRIQIEGEWPREKPEDIINGIRGLSAQHSDLTLLIDIRNMGSSESVAGDYYEARLFQDAGFWKFGMIAVLDNLNRKEANNFFETTAHNRGLRFRFFYADEQEAINWLLSKEQDQA